MKDSRKLFFMGLLTALLIFSNIVAAKITVVAKLPLPCSVFIYPFTFLCVAIITHLYGAKDGMKSIAFALITQIIFFGFSILVANVPNQVDTLAEANSIQAILAPEVTNGIYHPGFKLMIGAIVSFGVSQLINVGLYTFAKKYTFKAVSSALSILIALLIDAVIFVAITGIGNISGNTIGITLINQFVARVILTIVSVIIFCIFTIGDKKKEDKKVEKKA